MENKAYVYRHRRLDTNEIFYVGIGSDGEYKRAYNKVNRSKWWKSILSNTEYQVEIIVKNISIKEAKELEVFLISLYGRKDRGLGNLCNMSDGGEGAFGTTRSDLVRKKYQKSKLGSKNPMFNKSGILSPRFGKPTSVETRDKIRTKLGTQTKGVNNGNSKIVLNVETGIFYDYVGEAALAHNIKRTTLTSRLNGGLKNKTSLKYC